MSESDDLNSAETLLQFPCDFMIKVIGNNHENFLEDIKRITRVYFPEIPDVAFVQRASQESNYLAISITVWANDKITLDKLYLELTAHPHSKMVL